MKRGRKILWGAQRGVQLLLGGALLALWSAPAVSEGAPASMARVPAGTYVPLYSGDQLEQVPVAVFLLDRYLVTNADFAAFIAAHPVWSPGKPPAIKADHNYLAQWPVAPPKARMPVTGVSWFAAREYCRYRGKRLPTVAEWERAAAAPDAARPDEGEDALLKRILEWYGRANEEREVGSVYENIFGVFDLHGSVWEWTEDFNSVTIDADGREQGDSDRFCGAGGLNASNPRDYAAFMRQAFRSSLRAASTAKNLGFRCARNI
ncbi:MAG: formylglycine-generating enzyme family protein [bacterium]|nr:formylglycine-generating enzyme family protein [bacterium]